MARRVHIANGRVVISLPGYDAPSPPLEGLSFDSSWPFAGLVLSSGGYADPAPPHPAVSSGNLTETVSQHVIPVQRARSGYSHFIVLFFERSGSRITRQIMTRGTLANANTVVVQRKYREYANSQGSVFARGWERFVNPVGFMVIAG